MANTTFKTYANEHGGRVIVLFLLFLLAIYEFIHAGFPAFAVICLSPLLVLIVVVTFRYKMLCFWALVIVNYFIMWHEVSIPLPRSMMNEMFEIILLVFAILDVKNSPFKRLGSMMFFTILLWCGFCILQVLNDTCDIGIDVGTWYTSARLMAFQIMYAFLIFTLYVKDPKILTKYLLVWGALSLFAVFWVWKQKNIGFTERERAFVYGRAAGTHVLQSGTLIRYLSVYSDAASFGIGIAAAAVAFTIFGITSKIKKYKYFFLVTGAASIWAVFPSGTRTAIACLMAGFMAYIFLSKSFKIAIPVSIAFGIFAFILIFTDIGNGNQQIRRMRSAFDKNDASAKVRDANKAAMKKYMAEAPWGIGLTIGGTRPIPANNKFTRLATTAPDSEYVFIWVHTGAIGITIFLICNILMLLGACWIVFFTLKSSSLRGIGAGLCCAFVSIHLGAYANQILMQFPNCLITYGGLSIVYVLPHLEPEWIAYENQLLDRQEEKRRLRLEKIEKMRVKPWYSWIYKYL